MTYPVPGGKSQCPSTDVLYRNFQASRQVVVSTAPLTLSRSKFSAQPSIVMSNSDWDPNALTFPPPNPFDFPTVNPKPLKPLETPPVSTSSSLPSLPSQPRKSLIDKWYTLSTHLVPAAYPRTTPFVPVPPLPQWTLDKAGFKKSIEKTVDTLIGTKEALWHGQLNDLPPDRKPMWICINRYVPKRNASSGRGNGVTLFMCHANGFPKEVGLLRVMLFVWMCVTDHCCRSWVADLGACARPPPRAIREQGRLHNR